MLRMRPQAFISRIFKRSVSAASGSGRRRIVSNEGAPKTAALRGRLDLYGPGLVVGLAFEFRDKAYGRGGEGITHD